MKLGNEKVVAEDCVHIAKTKSTEPSAEEFYKENYPFPQNDFEIARFILRFGRA